MLSATVKSWDYIIDFYKGAVKNGLNQTLMLNLVSDIASNKVSEKLFPRISLLRLVISIYEPIEPFRESIHIEFDPIANLFKFTYYSLPFQDPTFVRLYSPKDATTKFFQFIEWINW
jgi:hypothetical protein